MIQSVWVFVFPANLLYYVQYLATVGVIDRELTIWSISIIVSDVDSLCSARLDAFFSFCYDCVFGILNYISKAKSNSHFHFELDSASFCLVIAAAWLVCSSVMQFLQDLPSCFQLASCSKSWLVQYSNWWPMLSALMYVLVPMPCLFFGGGSTQFLTSRDGGGWMDAAKFLTGASAVGSVAIPIILRHAGLIGSGAMFIEFTSFFIFVCTVLCFHRASLDDEW
ncbi:Vacuolar protein sorting-associated protein 55 [Sesamum angolense]|uniref:Vacuolar protein sorting-associated protein 55 n=1 Tax=Sesamum angolense TaxID=2727404 RepID=A0AAE1WIG2_9LAMI|nr:Vacuolar protein sorting-associated protein 55 [Sesamum angolense]